MQRFRFASRALLAPALFLGLSCFAPARAQIPPLTPELLQELLKLYPAADTDHDGKLSEAEARAYYATLRGRRSVAASSAPANTAPAPTLADVSYGPHARNVLDFWQAAAADSGHPAPVVVYIHGGGFIGGDKSSIRRGGAIQQCLDAGVSFAAINYRYLAPGAPIQDVLRDCGRAIQFLRTHASDWHIDPARIASHGDSAGAGASLWLAFHPDLADPKSTDPVLRESSRLVCVGANQPQFSYDMTRWFDEFGKSVTQRLGATYTMRLLYGLSDEETTGGPEGKKIRDDCDMLGLMTKDAPTVFLSVNLAAGAIVNTNQLLHHPRHAQLLYERCRELGVPVVASIPAFRIAPPPGGPQSWRDFLFEHLGVKPATPAATSVATP